MKHASERKQIKLLEQHYWEAMKNVDVETAVKLTHFPCTLVSPQGVRKIDEKEYRENMKSMDGSHYKDIKLENESIDILSEDVALVTYQIDFNNMRMQDVSTWVKTDGNWKCAFHSETPISH